MFFELKSDKGVVLLYINTWAEYNEGEVHDPLLTTKSTSFCTVNYNLGYEWHCKVTKPQTDNGDSNAPRGVVFATKRHRNEGQALTFSQTIHGYPLTYVMFTTLGKHDSVTHVPIANASPSP